MVASVVRCITTCSWHQKEQKHFLFPTRGKEVTKFKIDIVEIIPKNCIRYLGVYFDTLANFREHLERAPDRAMEKIRSLIQLMPNVGGPNSCKRAMLAGVVHSIVVYGLPIWIDALEVKRNHYRLERTQRTVLLRVASAYKTVLAVAVQVVTGTLPIDPMAEERKVTYIGGKREEINMLMIDKWQDRWNNNTNKGQLTKTLIPDIKKSIKCSHREIDYYLTQALTGHGNFKTYVKRIGEEEDDECTNGGD
ncbi:hypothetical protein Trydic_g21370 [Trypoxylus dichotomus]